MIVCLSKFQNYTRVMSNDNNNLHILKRIKDIDYKGIISSAVAVYFKEGVGTAISVEVTVKVVEIKSLYVLGGN
jgi:hypothetical protein